MTLNVPISNHNFFAFLWHALFLALANNFMDIDTVLPAMLLDAGGNSILLGFLTAVMIGSGQVSQLVFAPFLSKKTEKKWYLLAGINLRIISLIFLAVLFATAQSLKGPVFIPLIFLLITVFSVSGGFSNINYVDILGKSILHNQRKHFFSTKQIVTSVGVLMSAYFARKILQNFNFPQNYTLLFTMAGVLLAIASLGFWKIREEKTDPSQINSINHYFSSILTEIKSNKRLKHYLLVLNFQGVMLSLIPFMVLYAKSELGQGNAPVGNFLFLKVSGSILAGGILYFFSKKLKYRYLLYVNSISALIIVLLVLLVPKELLFPSVFLLAGLVFAFYTMTIGGVLLEVTTTQNRALYTGISGAGNLLPGIYPIIGGWMVNFYGFTVFFSMTFMILTFSLFFIYKLNCQH
ncbi:MAG: MFS transporter [Candidatus Marinimicrobia bacterium]|nr:MFS transporter [Candidatus Neomarinimicrobiota bacterium]